MATGQYSTLDNRNLIGLFDQLYEGGVNATWSNQIATSISSDRATENYGWLGSAPSLSTFTGDAMPESGLKAYAYNLTNVEYAASLRILEKDMRRDKIGQIEARIADMAAKAAEHWDALTAAQITSTVTTTHDGQKFFDTDHNESGTNQVNDCSSTEVPGLNTSSTTVPTADEMALILPQAIGHFHTLTDDKGDPINGNARDFTLICGTVPIWAAATHALTAMNLSSGASNQVQGLLSKGYKVNAILTPRLSASTTKFWLFRNDAPVKAFIHQTEVPIDPMMTDTTSDEYIKFRRFVLSIYTSRAVGYGRWQSAIQCTLS
jgi:phage major head subunit gpT-like protein